MKTKLDQSARDQRKLDRLPRAPLKHLCHETFPDAPLFDTGERMSVRLYQTGFDAFTVEYGKQRKERLTYSQAALEYGACIMHALACETDLCNMTPREAKRDGWSFKAFAAAHGWND